MLKDMQSVLEYAYDVFNKELFDDELTPVVITLQDRKSSYAHYSLGKEWRVEQEHLPELNISVRYIERDISAICASLVHEMCHHYANIKGLQDVSSNGRYHNKVFYKIGTEHGLILTRDPQNYIGWSITQPSERLIEIIDRYNIRKPLDINKDGIEYTAGGLMGGDGKNIVGPDGKPIKPKKKTSTRKYICPSCLNSIRATKDQNILCLDCNEQFIKADQ